MAKSVTPQSASQCYEPMSLPPPSPCHLLRLPPELIERALGFVGPMPETISREVTKLEQGFAKNLYQGLQDEITSLNKAIVKTNAYEELDDSKKRFVKDKFNDIAIFIGNVCRPIPNPVLITANNYIFIKSEVMTQIAPYLEGIFREFPQSLCQQLQLALSPSVGLPSLYCPQLKSAMLKAMRAASREIATVQQSTAMLLKVKNGRSRINAALDTARKIPDPLVRIEALRAVIEHLVKMNSPENGLTTAEYLDLLMEELEERHIHSSSLNHYSTSEKTIVDACCQIITNTPETAALEIQTILTVVDRMYHDHDKVVVLKTLIEKCPDACRAELKTLFTLIEKLPDLCRSPIIKAFIQPIPKGKDIDFLLPFIAHINSAINSADLRYILYREIMLYYLASNMPQHALRSSRQLYPTFPPAIAAEEEPQAPIVPVSFALLDLPQELLTHALSGVDNLPKFIARGISEAEALVPGDLLASLTEEVDALEKAIIATDDYCKLNAEQQQDIYSYFDSVRSIIDYTTHEKSQDDEGSEQMRVTPHNFPYIRACARERILPKLKDIFKCLSPTTREKLAEAVSPPQGLPSCHMPNLYPAVLRALDGCIREDDTDQNFPKSQSLYNEVHSLMGQKAYRLALAKARSISNTHYRYTAFMDIECNSAKLFKLSFRDHLDLLVEMSDEFRLADDLIDICNCIIDLLKNNPEKIDLEIKEILAFIQNKTQTNKKIEMLTTLARLCPKGCVRELTTINAILATTPGYHWSSDALIWLGHLPKCDINMIEATVDGLWSAQDVNQAQWPMARGNMVMENTVSLRHRYQQQARAAMIRYHLRHNEPEKAIRVYAKMAEAARPDAQLANLF